MVTADAIRDVRARAREADDRAAYYRTALATVREMVMANDPGAARFISETLAPTARPRVLVSFDHGFIEHPAGPGPCAEGDVPPVLLPRFVVDMLDVRTCIVCNGGDA